MIEVFHNSDFIQFAFNQTKPVEYGKLTKVAHVSTDDLEVAFKQTNHIDYEWWRNHNVYTFGSNHRSTSVGDVMYDTTTKQWWLVASQGFKKLNLFLIPEP
jgi:hypothetical protein